MEILFGVANIFFIFFFCGVGGGGGLPDIPDI